MICLTGFIALRTMLVSNRSVGAGEFLENGNDLAAPLRQPTRSPLDGLHRGVFRGLQSVLALHGFFDALELLLQAVIALKVEIVARFLRHGKLLLGGGKRAVERIWSQ